MKNQCFLRISDNLDVLIQLLRSKSIYIQSFRSIGQILKTFEVLNIFANVSIDAGQEAEYRTLVDNSRTVVETAFDSINQMIADLGGDQARLTTIEKNHENDISLLTKQLGNVEDIDSFEAINKFQALRTQLESSYQITSASRGFSLINFL